MTTTHTATPWHFGGKHSWEIYEPKSGVAICSMQVKESPWRDLDIDKANAELIVTAVNERESLLRCRAALAVMLPYAEQLFAASEAIDGLIDSRTNAECDIDEARQALALAGGKAQS